MRHLTVGVFHDETLSRELGKKGAESDILMFNRKMDDYIFPFMSPVADKLSAKSQIIATIHAAMVSSSTSTRKKQESLEWGRCEPGDQVSLKIMSGGKGFDFGRIIF